MESNYYNNYENNSQNIYSNNNILDNNNYNEINYQQNDNNYNFDQNQNYQENNYNQIFNYEQNINYDQNNNFNNSTYGNIVTYYNNNPLYSVIPASGPDAVVESDNYNGSSSSGYVSVQSKTIDDVNTTSNLNANDVSNKDENPIVIPASGPYANDPQPKSRGVILRFRKEDLCQLRAPESRPGFIQMPPGRPGTFMPPKIN